MRILAPGGLLIFQIPDSPLNPRQKIKQWLPSPAMRLFYLFKYHGRPVMELHGLKQELVIQLLEENGARLIDIQPDERAFQEWSSFHYCVTRQ